MRTVLGFAGRMVILIKGRGKKTEGKGVIKDTFGYSESILYTYYYFSP